LYPDSKLAKLYLPVFEQIHEFEPSFTVIAAVSVDKKLIKMCLDMRQSPKDNSRGTETPETSLATATQLPPARTRKQLVQSKKQDPPSSSSDSRATASKGTTDNGTMQDKPSIKPHPAALSTASETRNTTLEVRNQVGTRKR
jgi:hypothetical protein